MQQQFLQIIQEANDEHVAGLLYDWSFWARPKQLPPVGNWLVWLIRSGRGFGKTRTGAEWVISRAKNGPYQPIALVGQTKGDVRDTMIETFESSITKISPPWFMPKYEPSKRRVTWPNGMVGIVYSGDEPDQLRGPQHGTAWVDELAKFQYPRETWDNLMLGLRVGDTPRVCVTTTPRPIQLIQELVKDPLTVDVVGSSYENRGNLSQVFFDKVLSQYVGTRLGQQEIEGMLLSDVPGALWTLKTIDDNRVRSVATGALRRIVIGVDPPGSTAECGIVVAGIGADGHGFVLDDASVQGTPAEWGRAVVNAYRKWKADCIIAEVNQGGDMVEHTTLTMRTAEAGVVNVRKVHATRGKYTRAEPISALYEQNKIHHVGAFAELETQMCNWVPGDDVSPDRMDALVWALTDLRVGFDPGGWG